MSEKTILSVKDIVKTYPGVVAIDHVSFDVREGECSLAPFLQD